MKIKRLLLITIILFIFLGIGYSYLSTTLNINGTGRIVKHIHINHKDLNYNNQIDTGDMLVIDTERFYIYSNDGTNIKALAEWNLNAGLKSNGNDTLPLDNANNIQDSTARAWVSGITHTSSEYPYIGVTSFSNSSYWSNIDGQNINLNDSRNNIYPYLQNYKNILESKGVNISSISLITKSELLNLGCVSETTRCDNVPYWIKNTSYWTMSSRDNINVWGVDNLGYFNNYLYYYYDLGYGIRPVITVKLQDVVQDQSSKLEKIIYKAKTNIITEEDLGETTCVHVNGYSTTNNNGCNGDFKIRVSNYSVPNECLNEDFSQTSCGVVMEFVDIITNHNMNNTNTNQGGWPATSMRQFVNNDIYNALPKLLRDNIIDTKVISGYGGTNCDENGDDCQDSDNNGTGPEGNWLSIDKLYLLDGIEYSSYGDRYCSANAYERQLDYYSKIGITEMYGGGNEKQKDGIDSYYWNRSASTYRNHFFYNYGTPNIHHDNEPILEHGVSPSFRIK